jgi:hypothetical protein
MKENWTRTNLLHPINFHALKGNEHWAPRTRITFWNNRYMIITNKMF